MAFLERAMQRPKAGEPNPARASAPGSTYGTPQASRPAATPVSPAAASGPQGRPPAPSTSALGGPMATPISAPSGFGGMSAGTMSFPAPPRLGGSAPAMPPAGSDAAASSSRGGAGPFSRVAPQLPRPGQQQPQAPDTAAPELAVAAPPVRTFTGMPSGFDMRTLQPGEQAQTPWGPAVMGEDGKPRIQFTPEGEQAYRQAVVAERKKIRLPAGFEPLADSLPVTPGRPIFDPFSGKWS